jgi:hypothetical protein
MSPMSLRATFEKMATDLAEEIVDLMLDTPVREVAHGGRRPPRSDRRRSGSQLRTPRSTDWPRATAPTPQ